SRPRARASGAPLTSDTSGIRRVPAFARKTHGRGAYSLGVGSLSALRRGSLVTVVLVFGFLTLLLLGIVVIVDFVLSAHAFPYSLLVVAGLAFLFMLLQWLISPAIVRWAIRGRQEVTPQSNPWLTDTVTALAREASVPVPRLWVSSDESPNAFVFGRTVASSALVVTQGLLDRLNADEV